MCVRIEEHAVDSVFATANLEAVKVHVLPAERYLKDLAKPGDTRIASHQMRRQISGLMLRSTARSCRTSRSEDATASIPEAYFAALHTPRKWMLSRLRAIKFSMLRIWALR